MKISPEKIIAEYYNSWWIPALIAILMLFITIIASSIKTYLILYSENVPWPRWSPTGAYRSITFVYLLGFSLLGILTAAFWNFSYKRWIKAFVNLLMLPLISIAIILITEIGDSIVKDLKCESLMVSYQSIPPDKRIEPMDRSASLGLEPERFGSPEMFLVIGNVPYGGVYDLYAYINPGEPGTVNVDVIEPKKNWRLYVYAEPSDTSIGSSDNPRQLFLYHRELRAIGDCGKHPARVELWFVPDSNEYPRKRKKLLEKIFIIENIPGR
jgi:hypothetical protein